MSNLKWGGGPTFHIRTGALISPALTQHNTSSQPSPTHTSSVSCQPHSFKPETQFCPMSASAGISHYLIYLSSPLTPNIAL